MAQTSITINPDLLKFKMEVTGHTLESLSNATELTTRQISRIRQDGKTTSQSLKKLSDKLGCEPSELQNQYLIPQHKSWGVFTGLHKQNDTDPLLLENGWLMEHINGWHSLAGSMTNLNNNRSIPPRNPKYPCSPLAELSRKEQYTRTITTITSSNNAVKLIIKVLSFDNSLSNVVTIIYKPGVLNEDGLSWENFYNDNIFQYNNQSLPESDLLVKKLAESVSRFSDELYIDNHAIATNEEDIVYAIQLFDSNSDNSFGHQMFNSMHELEVALVGYLSTFDTKANPISSLYKKESEIDSHFILNIMTADRTFATANGFMDKKILISKVFKNNNIYQESCWNKTEKDKWKEILTESITFDPDSYEAHCESYNLPKSTLCLDVEKQIIIKTVSEFINECNH